MAAAVKRVERGKNYFAVRGPRVTERLPLREDIYVLCERYVDELEQQNARDNTHLYPYLQLKIQVRSLVTNVQKDISFYANIHWYDGEHNVE
jgi:hypothetical protein